ncbi:MAG: 16S rRNA processing protein RimM [Clostridia bacterium]|nr:16S rRNA processing protein RimM [Clostridia bacterium]
MEKLEVFEVVKPQGIKGELKVRILADGFFSVSNLKNIYASNGEICAIKAVRDAGGGFAFLTLNGVLTRNDAELLRGKIYYANKTEINKEKSAYFIVDLIGLTVYDWQNNKLGTVVDVMQSNVDMFKIKSETGAFLYVPHLKKLQPKIDVNSKTITFLSDELKDVVYYEN